MAAQEGLRLDIMTELRLGLPGSTITNHKKRVFSDIVDNNDVTTGNQKYQKMTQVVGWPPVCSYRKKNVQDKNKSDNSSSGPKLYVKVSMDGAPYLRKIDLSVHKEYLDLVIALEKLFGCFGCISKDSNGSEEYVPIYADKDGDWMLVGDVPWRMFVASCKRLRVMKSSDAKCFGL